MNYIKFPKILVISNNCFALNQSNGRVLGTLFKGIPKDRLAQFYITDGSNDFSVCDNYFLITDTMVISSLYNRTNIGREVKPAEIVCRIPKKSKEYKRYGRSAKTMLLRNIIWSMYTWWTSKFDDWLDCFNPDIVLLQSGDAPFMYNIASRIAISRHIPLVQFNTEYYYFSNTDYIEGRNGIFFRIFQNYLKKVFRKVMEKTALSIYNSEWLKEQYDNYFHKPSTFIYQSTNFPTASSKCREDKPQRIVYAGNLGFKRYEALIDIADALQLINKDLHLTVYGAIYDEELKRTFSQRSGLDYKGLIPYEELVDVITDSDILVIVESSRPEISSLTCYGFSTKITDALKSGVPILAYGPCNNVGINYLERNNAAVVVHDVHKLNDAIRKLLEDRNYREELVKNARELCNRNHDGRLNHIKFCSIMSNLITHN